MLVAVFETNCSRLGILQVTGSAVSFIVKGVRKRNDATIRKAAKPRA
jgi:hypothetical protein